MIPTLDSIFTILTPATYWAVAIVWTIVFAILVRNFGYAFRTKGVLTLLIAVLAIDAIRTVIETLYFGALFNSYFGVLRPSVQEILQTPALLAIPKLVNLVSGLLVLFLIVGRWIPSSQLREDGANTREREREVDFARELEKQRQNLLIAQSVAKVGSWETDLDTLNVKWSAETFRIFEVNPATFFPTHQNFLNLVEPIDREAVDKAFHQSFDSGEVCKIEHRIALPDGRVKHIVERWQTLVDAEGKHKAIGTSHDITDLRVAEARAIEALEILKIAGRVARLGAWSFDIATKRLTWSEETRRIHEISDGYDPTLEDGINFYAPEFRSRIESVFSDCVASGKPFDEILQIVTTKGTRIWVKSSGVAQRNEKDEIIGVRGAIQDISEIIAREESLRLLETAISRLNDIVLITDCDLDEPGPRIVMVNDSFERITGYSRNEALGRSPRFLQGTNTQSDVLKDIRQSLQNGMDFRGELLNYTKDGREFLLEIEIFPITDELSETMLPSSGISQSVRN